MADNAPSRRILHITRNLPPLVGGMERLNWHIADEFSRWADVQVIGPYGAAVLKPANVALDEVPLRPLPCFLLASAAAAHGSGDRQQPAHRRTGARAGDRRRPDPLRLRTKCLA